MPLYEFRCLECNHNFETLTIDSSEVVSCKKCGSLETRKLISSFGINKSSSENSPSVGNYISCGCNSGCGCRN